MKNYEYPPIDIRVRRTWVDELPEHRDSLLGCILAAAIGDSPLLPQKGIAGPFGEATELSILEALAFIDLVGGVPGGDG